jgi:hypothetical protein
MEIYKKKKIFFKIILTFKKITFYLISKKKIFY